MKTITDGSAVFTVRDKRMQAMVDMFYPVGSVYISADKSKTKADFPFMAYGTWEEIPANLCLQTGATSEAGTQRSAGLPNLYGYFSLPRRNNDAISDGKLFRFLESLNGYPADTEDNGRDSVKVGFNASILNPIYGASNTVQPPAYMVRAWVRTA